MSNNIPLERIMTVTEARRNMAFLINSLNEGDFVLVKGGKPVAKVSSIKKKKPEKELTAWDKLKDFYGAWKDTDLDNDKLWEDILVKGRRLGTRKKRIRL